MEASSNSTANRVSLSQQDFRECFSQLLSKTKALEIVNVTLKIVKETFIKENPSQYSFNQPNYTNSRNFKPLTESEIAAVLKLKQKFIEINPNLTNQECIALLDSLIKESENKINLYKHGFVLTVGAVLMTVGSLGLFGGMRIIRFDTPLTEAEKAKFSDSEKRLKEKYPNIPETAVIHQRFIRREQRDRELELNKCRELVTQGMELMAIGTLGIAEATRANRSN